MTGNNCETNGREKKSKNAQRDENSEKINANVAFCLWHAKEKRHALLPLPLPLQCTCINFHFSVLIKADNRFLFSSQSAPSLPLAVGSGLLVNCCIDVDAKRGKRHTFARVSVEFVYTHALSLCLNLLHYFPISLTLPHSLSSHLHCRCSSRLVVRQIH